MTQKRIFLLLLLALAVALSTLSPSATAADVKITLPKRSSETPVQKLNRQGVKAVEKHDYEKAKKLFYQAYLIDPNDPFTLNNLGYISELEGRLDRAERFYSLAAEQRSEATIDQSSVPEGEGKPVNKVAGSADNRSMQVNRFNVQAIGLLMKDRAPEADLVLQNALALDPKNPFTLNNLGFAKEKEGELEAALSYYTQAANLHSQEPIIVTLNSEWRGKAISEIATRNAKKVRKELKKEEKLPERVARLNLRGVSALNRNDRKAAHEYFQQAYKLDPNDAFTLNNMGYLAELEDDRETAGFYYAKAGEARRSNQRVTVATRRNVEGMRLGTVAGGNDRQVQQRIADQQAAKKKEGGPVLLKRRDNTPVIEPDKPAAPPSSATQPEAGAPPDGQLLQPLPENQQPGAAQGPGSQPPGSNQQPGPDDHALPPATPPDNINPPVPSAPGGSPAPSPNQPPNGSAQPPDNSGNNGGLLEPLPDDQQPPNANRGPVAPAQPPPQ